MKPTFTPLALVLCLLGLARCSRPAPPPAPEPAAGPSALAPAAASPPASADPSPLASAAPPPAETTAAAACPEGEVAIPPTGPGGFTMGRAYRGATDPPHQVVLTRAYCMDETEVTASAYQKCVEASVCKLPFQGDTYSTYGRKLDNPVNMVSWDKARRYCEWNGKRLPTEAEWEWAATGPEGTRYPWGDSPEPSCGVGIADFTPFGAPKSNPGGDVGCFGGGPSAVKAHPRGAKHWPGGDLYDLGGNVWEWTEDSYAPYTKEPQIDPLVRQETAIHAIRGGGWNRPARALQGAFRGSAIHTYQVPGLGFRCARGAPHSTPPPRRKPAPRP